MAVLHVPPTELYSLINKCQITHTGSTLYIIFSMNIYVGEIIHLAKNMQDSGKSVHSHEVTESMLWLCKISATTSLQCTPKPVLADFKKQIYEKRILTRSKTYKIFWLNKLNLNALKKVSMHRDMSSFESC